MNPIAARCLVSVTVLLAITAPVSLLADDSAVSIAAGGLVPRRETRIVMAKEVLRISDKKVVVDYDFRNDTDEGVTTEVAFPIPPYRNEFPEGDVPGQSFQSFRLWVDGKPIHYQIEATATLNGKDVTGILRANHIDIPTLGHFVDDKIVVTQDFQRLSKPEREKLVKSGLFDDQGDGQGYNTFASWTAHVQYHWTQTFPAHSIVHIRHEYSPAEGFTQVTLAAVEDSLSQFSTGHGTDDPYGAKLLAGFCADRPFLSALQRLLNETVLQAKTEDQKLMAGTSYPHWVDFILTSANTWQRPIEDFTLILERPSMEERHTLISFCSPGNGKVEKVDADHFQVHLTNFVPAAELHIGFFDLPSAKPATKK
jgi:hypothetical protein